MGTDKSSIDKISKQIHVSRSTVSRALNNCGSVNQTTKEAILQSSRELNYIPEQKKRVFKKGKGHKIGVVMPINPYYFWNEAVRGMKACEQQHEEFQVVFSLFGNMYSEQDVLYCLDYMQDLKVDVLVITPPFFTSVWNRLRDICQKTPVVCFNETADIPYLFYAGANFYQDGVRLARASVEALRNRSNILIVQNEQFPMVKERDEGFTHEITSLLPNLNWVGTIDIRKLSASTLSAQLARIINDQYQNIDFQSVYVSQGFLPQVCLALYKLKLSKKIAVVGYENPNQNAIYTDNGTITAFLEQDTYTQGYQCIEAVNCYLKNGVFPENNRVLVPSRLYPEEQHHCQ